VRGVERLVDRAAPTVALVMAHLQLAPRDAMMSSGGGIRYPTTPTRSARSRRVPEKLTTIGVTQRLLWPLLSGWASASHM
jgi:hypothetical protein